MRIYTALKPLKTLFRDYVRKRKAQKYFKKGVMAFKRGRSQIKVLACLFNCIQCIEHSQELMVRFSEVYLMISSCYMNLRKFELAMNWLEYYEVIKSEDVKTSEFCQDCLLSIEKLKYVSIKSAPSMYEEGIRLLLDEMKRAPGPSPTLHFNVAAFYAAQDNERRAIFHLHSAFSSGFNDWNQVFQDHHFDTILNSREFVGVFLRHCKI